MQSEPKIAVVGGGIAGMMAALRLAHEGFDTTLFEGADRLGGKIRTETFSAGHIDAAIDCGPTVFSLKPLFEQMFDHLGHTFDSLVKTNPEKLLARHYWENENGDVDQLDLFADLDQSTDAIGELSGTADAQAFRSLLGHSRSLFDQLDHTFMRSTGPNPISLVASLPFMGLPLLAKARPWQSVWSYLKGCFADPRLVQLFARYSTYCGGNPMKTSALLLLVLEAEMAGLWSLDGGIASLARAMETLLRANGVTIKTGQPIERILTKGRSVCGVQFADGGQSKFDKVVWAGDVSAAASILPPELQSKAPTPVRAKERSNSAATLTGVAELAGVPVANHTVFFSRDYEKEFAAIERGEIPHDPTLYLNRTQLGSPGSETAAAGFFCIANARAMQHETTSTVPKDTSSPTSSQDGYWINEERQQWQSQIEQKFTSMGLTLNHRAPPVLTLPQDFAARYPGSGGALFGRAPHGMFASFLRPGLRSKIQGLYFAGGSAHPSAGLPMAALSGFTAAGAVSKDLASMKRHYPAGTYGGTSTL